VETKRSSYRHWFVKIHVADLGDGQQCTGATALLYMNTILNEDTGNNNAILRTSGQILRYYTSCVILRRDGQCNSLGEQNHDER